MSPEDINLPLHSSICTCCNWLWLCARCARVRTPEHVSVVLGAAGAPHIVQHWAHCAHVSNEGAWLAPAIPWRMSSK